ncbi:MAG: transcriptional regulator [Planctomycetota bacterium]|nr:MAG: transcriptional regulator [Planctomycetota bacterium]
MKLRLQTDYALRLLMDLARRDAPSTLAQIAADFDISREHLVKVAQRLAALGYVTTRAGRGGGVELAADPEAIDVGEVLAAVEGRSGVLDCVNDSSACVLEPGCRLRRLLMRAESAFYDTLRGTTLASLVSRPTPGRGIARLPLN